MTVAAVAMVTWHVAAVPVQLPDPPAKVEPGDGAAVSVTTASASKLALHVAAAVESARCRRHGAGSVARLRHRERQRLLREGGDDVRPSSAPRGRIGNPTPCRASRTIRSRHNALLCEVPAPPLAAPDLGREAPTDLGYERRRRRVDATRREALARRGGERVRDPYRSTARGRWESGGVLEPVTAEQYAQ